MLNGMSVACKLYNIVANMVSRARLCKDLERKQRMSLIWCVGIFASAQLRLRKEKLNTFIFQNSENNDNAFLHTKRLHICWTANFKSTFKVQP